MFNFYSFSLTAQTGEELNDILIHYFNIGEFEKGIIVAEKEVYISKKQFGETHENYPTSTINDAFAQADMRKKYSPFYWAAFVLVE